MSFFRLIVLSLRYHWRANAAVAMGVAAGAAVLTGALLVGDSMRGSLRDLTLDRLGKIDEVLVTEGFFREKLAVELGATLPEDLSPCPALLLRATLENPTPFSEEGLAKGNTLPKRANRVNLLGCNQHFWQLGPTTKQIRPKTLPGKREIVLNRPLADMLNVEKGNSIVLRLPNSSDVPADSPLGRKQDTVDSARVTVVDIIPAEGLGRFGLRPSQHLPRNAYVSLSWLQERLDQPERINTILLAGTNDRAVTGGENVAQKALRPRLNDYGVRLDRAAHGYFNITSDRMILAPAVEQALKEALRDYQVQPVLVHVANTIACGDREVPYSTVAAVDFADEGQLGPLLSTDGQPIGPIAENEIVLNSWTAEDLQAQPGDMIRMTFFEPETTHGETRETTVEMRLAAIAALEGRAADRDFVPRVSGITDKLTMSDWDPPFPFDSKRVRDEDDLYWEDHGPTPKAFVSLATGRRLWQSRFGKTTSLRVTTDEATGEQPTKATTPDLVVLTQHIETSLDPTAMGFTFQPVKRQGLEASTGTTPFGVLFLSFSFFIIAAAIMLVALLFRLGVDQRASSVGLLLAIGLTRKQIRRLFLGEGLTVAVLGSTLGTTCGVAYAALMLLGLRTWWLAAVATPFLSLHVTLTSILAGLLCGAAAAMLAITWSLRKNRKAPARRLLAGVVSQSTTGKNSRPRHMGIVVASLLSGAVAVGLFAGQWGEQARAGAFFGAGSMVLVASLILIADRLRTGATGPAIAVGRGNLIRMSVRNAARNPGRSTLTIGLVASTTFLIVSVSAFHLDPSDRQPSRNSGDGGFALISETDQPVYHDPNTPAGRAELGFSQTESAILANTTTLALRVKPGDDASCLNLYQARQPRVLAVSEAMIRRGGFTWVESAAATPAEKDNPWVLLHQELETDTDGTPLVPVVIDQNTAMYALHLYGGVGTTYDIEDNRGQTIRLKIVGLLAGSIFQGDLLIGPRHFARHFPDVSGYRIFLTEIPEPEGHAKIVQDTPRPSASKNGRLGNRVGDVRDALENRLGDFGLVAETTGTRLSGLLAVQNTYLSTFQSLGGLGLLLGTFGLAAVQLRNVLERRAELALLRATGFRPSLLALMVLVENGLLLLTGLGCGILAAGLAVLPHLLTRAAVIPFPTLAATLGLVLAVGMFAGSLAVRAALAVPLLAALREEN